MKTNKITVDIPAGKKAEWKEVDGQTVLVLVDEVDSPPVTERIKTFADAVKELGEDHPFVIEYRAVNGGASDADHVISDDLLAYLKLRIITAALNEGWEPQFTRSERRSSPWFTLWTEDELATKDEEWKKKYSLQPLCKYRTEYASSASGHSFVISDAGETFFSSRLCFKSSDLADYAGNQFACLWMDYYLIRK